MSEKPKLCLTCLGYGRITVKRKWTTCPDCNGSGSLNRDEKSNMHFLHIASEEPDHD